MWQLLVPLATGAISGMNASRKNEQMKAQNLAAAEQTRYSPWTKMGAGQINTNYADPMMSAIQGGVQGAMFAQGLPSGSSDVANTAGQVLPSYEGQNMLGGVDYSSQLGAQYTNAFQKPNYFASK